jgi:ribosomal protein S18 acetylase RimI-like enzyme
MPHRIRPATLADADTLVRFNAAMALETERIRLDPAVLGPGVRAVLEDPARGRYFVAESDGRVVGQLLVTYEWSDWRNGNIWWLQSVYVDPPHRRRGVFRALYRHAEALARAQGAVAIRLYVHHDNRPAQDTYRRLGMRDAGYIVMEESLTRNGRNGTV